MTVEVPLQLVSFTEQFQIVLRLRLAASFAGHPLLLLDVLVVEGPLPLQNNAVRRQPHVLLSLSSIVVRNLIGTLAWSGPVNRLRRSRRSGRD